MERIRNLSIEKRVKRLETAVSTIIRHLELKTEISEELGVDPFNYARDDLDKRIIEELLRKRVATATQIHKKLKLGTELTRQALGKRLKRMMVESSRLGLQWLEYNPKRIKQHFRAWWIIPEAIKPQILQKYEEKRR